MANRKSTCIVTSDGKLGSAASASDIAVNAVLVVNHSVCDAQVQMWYMQCKSTRGMRMLLFNKLAWLILLKSCV